MAYRLDPRRGTAEDVRAIAGEQIARALAELGDERLPLSRRVFQLRRRSKKLRALLRLIRESFGDFDRENAAIRDAARELATLRDSEAMRDALRSLAGHVPADTLIALADTLESHVVPADGDERIAAAAAQLGAVAARAPDWQIEGEGFDALEGGLIRTYRETMRAMRAAAEARDAVLLHDWRGRAKHHWSHLSLLRAAAPVDGETAREVAAEVARRLGDHHNLEVLRTSLDLEAAMLTAIDARQAALASEALALGEVLFGERPGEVRRRWRELWQAAAAQAAQAVPSDEGVL